MKPSEISSIALVLLCLGNGYWAGLEKRNVISWTIIFSLAGCTYAQVWDIHRSVGTALVLLSLMVIGSLIKEFRKALISHH